MILVRTTFGKGLRS